MTLAKALAHPDLAGVRLDQFVRSIHARRDAKSGRTHAPGRAVTKAFARAGVTQLGVRKVGDLTERQRKILCVSLNFDLSCDERRAALDSLLAL